MPFAVLAVGWGCLYITLGEFNAGLIPLSYSVFSLVSILLFAITKKYKLFKFSQLFLILFLPPLLMYTLGGFFSGSAVVIWALIAPLGALMFDELKNSLYWFIAFLLIVLVSGFIQPFIHRTNLLSEEIIVVLFVMNIMGVSFLVFSMVYFFVKQKDLFQEKSETLLLNILPKEIVSILKNEPRTIADHFEGASILFADVVNFTVMSARMSPIELVDLLNQVFTRFDEFVEKSGLEKIKTIGDCYMVASGVPRPRKDHAEVLTDLALEMIHFIQDYEFNGLKLSFRIGINSGPVVAGVIGSKKFIYDLWGDSVNTASRMESHGEEGVIQITRATYEQIKDKFVCEPKGSVIVKGKGEMEVWHVKGRI